VGIAICRQVNHVNSSDKKYHPGGYQLQPVIKLIAAIKNIHVCIEICRQVNNSDENIIQVGIAIGRQVSTGSSDKKYHPCVYLNLSSS
jgi:hypothetical protein